MSSFVKVASIVISIIFLTACSGGGDDTKETPPVTTVPNTPPSATLSAFSSNEDVEFTGTLTGIDSDGDTLTYIKVSDPSHGVITIDSNGSFTYTSTLNYFGSDSFTYKVNDGTVDSTDHTVDITVVSVNDLPTISSSEVFSVDENVFATINITATDVDHDVLAYTLSGADANYFNINTLSGAITFKVSPDFEYKQQYLITADVSDGNGSVSQNITININDMLDVLAVLENSSGSVAENASVDTVVGNITISTVGDSPITSITLNGTGNENFQVSTDGTITVKLGATLDYETVQEYNLTATAANGAGISSSVDVHIAVTDVIDTKAVLANATGSIAEDAATGDSVGTIVITDSGDSPITAIILSGTGYENFEVATNGVITVKSGASLDFETTPVYTLMAVAVNGAGSSTSVTLTITVTNVIDTVAALADTVAIVEENSIAGTIVGNLIIVNPGDSAISAIALSGAGSTNFVLDTSGVIKVATGAQLDYETTPVYNLTAIATNGAGDSNSVSLDINISDIGELVILDNSTVTVPEDATNGTVIGNITITDMGDSAITAITLNGVGSNNFVVDVDGNISMRSGATLDYETLQEYNLTAVATNSTGDSDSIRVDIMVTDVLEAPVLSASTSYIAEDALEGAHVGTVSITDEGDNAITSISLSGTGSTNFDVANNGEITLAIGSTLDYESNTVYNLSAIATNTSGDSTSVDITIYITDVVDTVAILGSTTGSVAENAVSGTAVGIVPITSIGDSNITAIVLSGTGSSNFSVGTDGNITVAVGASLDYETKTSYSLTAVATNGAGSSSNASVSITVTDIAEIAVLEASIATIDETAVQGDVATGVVGILDIGDGITTITLSGTGSENFDIDVDGVISVASGATLDYETTAVYNLTAVASTNAGDSAGVTLEISVNNYENPFLIAKIEASDAEAGDLMGNSVAVSGDYIVVGANGESTYAGSAYVYKKLADGSLQELAVLHADVRGPSANFGRSVAISGNYIVVGADTPAGIGYTYLFKINSDTDIPLITKFTADDVASSDLFGKSVAINGDYIVVGSTQSNSAMGSTYVFKIIGTTVSQIAKLVASDAESNDQFGYSVSIDNGYIIVGAPYEDTGGGSAGSAYLFKINSDTDVSELVKIQSNVTSASDYFGYSVSISGSYIVVGAYMDDTTATDAGSAYLFKINTDSDIGQIATFQGDDAAPNDHFGYSVSIDRNYIAVGAYTEDTTLDNLSGAGSAYLFKRNSDIINDVVQVEKLQANDSDLNDEFGWSVAISGENTVVGAHNEDSTLNNKPNSGSAYVFDTEPFERAYVYNDPVSAVQFEEHFSNVPVYTLDTASPNGGSISLALSGIDASSFQLNDNNLSFVTNADFESPEDAGLNNEYNITVTATLNSNSYDTVADIGISVQDKYYFDLEKIQASDHSVNNRFGYAVAVNGNYMMSGTYSDDSAYLFKKELDGTSTEIVKIIGDDTSGGDFFGRSVAISGDYIVVGASREDTTFSDAGSVYVFKRISDSSVVQIAKLQAHDAEQNDYFGVSVAIDGAYIVVGATGEDTTVSGAGSVYVFKINSDSNVSEIAKVQANDPESGSNFGQSVSISGSYFIVGAYLGDTTIANTGSAYLFKIISDTSSTQIAKVVADDAANYDYFGWSVSISGNYFIVGAPKEDTGAAGAGSAYVFKRNSDTVDDILQVAKIVEDNPENSDNFGHSVSISGDYMVVGAHQDNSSATSAGSAFIFRRLSDSNVTKITQIEAFDAEANDLYGTSVSISGDNVIVGAYQEDTGGIDAGSAYLYVKDSNQVE